MQETSKERAAHVPRLRQSLHALEGLLKLPTKKGEAVMTENRVRKWLLGDKRIELELSEDDVKTMRTFGAPVWLIYNNKKELQIQICLKGSKSPAFMKKAVLPHKCLTTDRRVTGSQQVSNRLLTGKRKVVL